MADKIPPRFRKTKSDKWAVMAPVADLQEALDSGGDIEVQRKSGEWSTFTIGSLGRPFDVDGVEMAYGYAPEPEGDDSEPGVGSDAGTSPATGGGSGPVRNRDRSGSSGAATSPRRASSAPPRDPSEPLPEFQGGPEDEWDGFG